MLPISFAGGIIFGIVFAGVFGILAGAMAVLKLGSNNSVASTPMTRSHEDRRYMSKGLANYYEGR